MLGCTRVVGDLNATRVSGRVVVDVEVGRLVEAMQERSNSRLSKVIVDVGEAVPWFRMMLNASLDVDSHCNKAFFARKWWHGSGVPHVQTTKARFRYADVCSRRLCNNLGDRRCGEC